LNQVNNDKSSPELPFEPIWCALSCVLSGARQQSKDDTNRANKSAPQIEEEQKLFIVSSMANKLGDPPETKTQGRYQSSPALKPD
jgi:hypothetical protein